jgi:hypothetical protein
MCQTHNATSFMHNFEYSSRCNFPLINKCRSPARQISTKSFWRIRYLPTGDEGTRDVRPRRRCFPRFFFDVFVLDANSDFDEFSYDFASTAAAIRTVIFQECAEVIILPVETKR